MLLLDANIYIRYILKDNLAQALEAQLIINDNEIYTDPTIIAEVIWVFTSFYKMEKHRFISPLLSIIDQKSNKSPSKKLIIQALEFFSTHNLSYIDCYLHCLSQAKDIPLATFDTKLSKMK